MSGLGSPPKLRRILWLDPVGWVELVGTPFLIGTQWHTRVINRYGEELVAGADELRKGPGREK